MNRRVGLARVASAVAPLVAAVGILMAAGCGGQDTTSAVAASASAPDPSASTPPAGRDDPAGGAVAPGGHDPGLTPSGDVASAIRSLPPASATPSTVPAGPAPVALRIGDLDITDAPVVPVGVLDNGEFEVPEVSDVGWYRHGARPGPDGSTVMAAHIAYDGVDGVFAELADLRPGATVEVVLEDQQVVTYEVVETASYIKTALPFDEIFAQTGDPQLVLISCGGRFDPVAGSYDSNIVAYAVPLT